MTRYVSRLIVILFWLAMLYWLVRYEAFPDRFTKTSAGYRSLLRQDALGGDSWMRILFGEQPLGYARSQMEVNENDPNNRYVVRSTVHLNLNLMGEAQEIQVHTAAFLDIGCTLQKFTFDLSSPGQQLHVEGQRHRGPEFAVQIRSGETTRETTVQIPDDVVIYSPMTEMAMKNLRPGEELAIRIFDPATLGSANVLIKALRKERIQIGREIRDTTLLSVNYMNVEFLSWVDTDGVVQRQTTPFGWTLEACTADEAYAAMRAAVSSGDLLKRMAVPCEGVIRNPRSATELTFRLKGIAFADGELESNRQIVRRREGAETDLLVRAAKLPPAEDMPEDLAGVKSNLLASTWIQSDDPEIIKRALEITRGCKTNLEKAIAIHDWIHSRMTPQMTVGLPSAVEVLKTLKGDCNEHTYLFVALARAAGIPARVIVGVAYRDGKFYYHAWPAVFVGDWVEMDPTWGQKTVDATHIALLTGEFASQMRLANIMGRLKIQLLEER